MLDLFEKLEEAVADVKVDIDKFNEKGVKAAAVRARAKLRNIRSLAKDLGRIINEAKKDK